MPRSRVLAVLTALLLAPLPAMAQTAPRKGALTWLQQYVRLDTTNPPGNEHRAAALLSRLLHREGIATRTLVTPRGRASLYARLRAEQPERGALVLVHHTDVVPPGPGWTRDPFSGEIDDGRLWGRGAVDDKSLGIAHLAAFVALKRNGVRLTRDVVFLAVADEETGGREGVAWLLEHHPELFERAETVLGEGGNNRAFQGRARWFGVEVAQKRPLWLEVTARGREGHGSTMDLHTAPHRLVRALARVVDRQPQFRVSPEARVYFQSVAPMESPALAQLFADLDGVLARARGIPNLPPGIPNYLSETVQVNWLQAGERINVIPGEAKARIDVRMLPDTDGDAFLASLVETLGDEVEVEVLLEGPRVEPSPTTSPDYKTIERVLGRLGPVVPAFIPGVTDSRYFRERGIAAYGLSPFLLDSSELRGIHGPDERIPVADFERGVALMTELVAACAGG